MAKPQLLILEDDLEIAAIIEQIGMEAGYGVATASTSSDFYRLYQAVNPIAISMDILMPDMDAFEALKYMQAHQCKARIIFISGSENYRSMVERMARSCGLLVEANLGKPFRVEEVKELLNAINEALPVKAEDAA